MPEHVTKDPRSGWAAIRKGAAPDDEAGFDWDASGNPQIVDTGGVVRAKWDSAQGVSQTYRVSVAGGASSSGVFSSTANPFGFDVVVTRCQLRVTTQSSGAATVDIGVAANATTSSDGLIDGKSVAAMGLFDSAVAADAGTNGRPSQVWSASQFLNVAEASGDVDGLAATVLVTCIKAS